MLINRKSREGYGKAVDWWSLGTLMYEMLTGWPPFYDKNLRKMCEQILRSDLHFPPGCTASAEARDLIRGLLARDPAARLGSRHPDGLADIKGHPFFRGANWEKLERKEVTPPFVPREGGAGGGDAETDIANFDTTFTNEPAVLTPPLPSELSAVGGVDFTDFGFVSVGTLPANLQTMVRDSSSGAAAAAAAASSSSGGGGGGGGGSPAKAGAAAAPAAAASPAPAPAPAPAAALSPTAPPDAGASAAGGSSGGAPPQEPRVERAPLDPQAEADLQAHLTKLALATPTLASLVAPSEAAAAPPLALSPL